MAGWQKAEADAPVNGNGVTPVDMTAVAGLEPISLGVLRLCLVQPLAR